MSLLEIANLDVRHGLLRAVRNISFNVEKGAIVSLIGANGAGKTTLLRALAGAHPISAGSIRFAGENITNQPAFQRVAAGIALVPEGRRLFGRMTIAENLMLAAATGRHGRWTMTTVLEAFPNLKPRLHAKTSTLSGGEQQATAIGRALMTNPDVLLLDEVSLGLSPLVVERVYAQLQGLMSGQTTIILVEQDLKRAMAVASHIICMLEGAIVLQGKAGELTRDQVTQAYFGLGRARPAAVLP